jgi:cytochrome c oxidase cbb3-type subunit 3
LQIAEYDKSVVQAEAEVAAYLDKMALNVDENSIVFEDNPEFLASGKGIYDNLCVQCHGPGGEGGVGPNFADSYWIHGGSINDIFKTIKYGVPQKGMISWQTQLSPTEMRDVASYIYKFEGTSPPNQKDPQGDLYDRSGGSVSGEAAATDSTATDAAVEAE